MEELKLLIDMVANLPQMAMWVIAAFWAYKVVCIGSIYGIIRLAINKTHAWLVTPKHEINTIEVRGMIDKLCIIGLTDDLIHQLKRIAGKGVGFKSGYIHQQSIAWLSDAIDDKIEKDRLAAK